LKPSERIRPFDAALIAFEIRFEQELSIYWNKLESEAAYAISGTPSGTEKGSLLRRFFSDAADGLAEHIHLNFSKLLNVATAHRKCLGEQSPLGWTSSQVRRNVCNFLGMDERFDPLSPLRNDSRVLNTALQLSTNAQPWDEFSIPSRLPAWVGHDWSMRAAMSRSKEVDLSWAGAEPLSLPETQKWAKFREHDLYSKIEKQIEADGYDGVIVAAASGISVLDSLEAENSSARRNRKAPPLGHKKLDLTSYLVRAGLTDRQYQCFSLRFEYGLKKSEIARRLSIDRRTVDEHIAAADVKIEKSKLQEKSDRNFAKTKPGEFRTNH